MNTEGVTPDLVQRAARGDEQAFESILRQVEPQIVSFLGSKLASRPDASVDEATQEFRLYLYRRLDRYDPQYPLIVFARGLARNIAKRFLFKRSDLASPPGNWEEDESWGTDLSPLELQDLPRNLQDALGGDRFEGPEGLPPPSREFLELFEIFLKFGGYPHQQVAFGHSILIFGKAKSRTADQAAVSFSKVPITGDPDAVVREVSPLPLGKSSASMIQEIGTHHRLDHEYLGRVRRPLEYRLDLSGAELFARDKVSFRQFESLATATVRGTRLLDYCGKDVRKSVSDWTRTVKERIKKVFLDPGNSRRIPLPHPPDPPEPEDDPRTPLERFN